MTASSHVKTEGEGTTWLTRRSIAGAVAFTLSVSMIYFLSVGGLDPWKMRNIALTATATLVFLLYPSAKNARVSMVVDLLLVLAALAVGAYIFLDFDALLFRVRVLPNPTDVLVGFVAIALVLEMTRRTEGLPLAIIAICALLYARYGNYFPGMLQTRGYTIQRIVGISFGTDGIYGLPLGAATTYALLFIIFGAFLNVSKAGDFFMQLANAVAGRTRGGPAKISVVASSLFGTITGSSVANVVTTGTLTIPAMIRTGYSPVFAAAVEAVSSTGGQIVPPVMGAAAFIMAEYLGIPYAQIVIAAIIPAAFYYGALFWMVHLRAVRTGLAGLKPSEITPIKTVLREGWHLLIPIAALLYSLVILQSSPIRAGLWGIAACIPASWLNPRTRLNVKQIAEALRDGAISAAGVMATCAASGLIIATFSLTGLGLKLASAVIAYSQGQLPIALFLSMIIMLILGTGVPSVPAYAIGAAVVAPALIQLGVAPLPAHLFVFYFAALSAVTPPVALAAYAAAGIAKANPMRSGVSALILALAGFLIPYVFVYAPSILVFNAPVMTIVGVVVTGTVGIIALGMALEGWIFSRANFVERLLLFAAALTLVDPGTTTDLVGAVLMAGGLYLNWRRTFRLAARTEGHHPAV